MTTAATPAPVNIIGGDAILRTIPIQRLIESGHNPRSHYDQQALIELGASILNHGVLEPLVVRGLEFAPNQGSTYEIIAGSRRFRAAKLAGLTGVPCVIRTLTDHEVLEIFMVENAQRADLAPLDQARSIKQLMDADPEKYTLAHVAARIGMAPAWVWDRVKLLDLIPDALELLEQQRITIGHAILISRQTPADQARIIAPRGGSIHSKLCGLWQNGAADGLVFEDRLSAERDRYAHLKPVTIRELGKWIDDNIRFDVQHAAKAVPLVFAGVAERVAEAEAQPGRGKKMVAITFSHFTQPDARSDEERTYGPASFRIADGQEHQDWNGGRKYLAKVCEHAILGVVKAGEGRGTAMDVCVARDKCLVHWKPEIDAKAKAEKLRTDGKGKAAKRVETAAEKREAKERERREAARARWAVFYPRLCRKALGAPIPQTLNKAMFAAMLAAYELPKTTTAAQLPRALFVATVNETFTRHAWPDKERDLVKMAALLGVDADTCEPDQPEAVATEKKARPKPAKSK